MNESLANEVMEEELKHALVSMQRGKSHGPDGLIVELYGGFYDLEKFNLLQDI